MRPLNCIILYTVAACTAISASGQSARRPFLFKDSRAEVAAARARGEKELTLVIASARGANAKLAKTILAMGGTINFRDDDVDYLRARVPVDSVEKIARDPNLFSLDVSKKYQPQANGASNSDSSDERSFSAAITRVPESPCTRPFSLPGSASSA
ncbi:MAG: hypothetical protein NTZ43_09540 [Gemmatimonadetes bacterium]|nr:hypothetical protein [Gemmatimonadota bacterium]